MSHFTLTSARVIGTAPPIPSFPEQEYVKRIERARDLMARHGLSCLLITDEHNFRYFTGDISHSPVGATRPKFLVLPLNSDPIAITPVSYERPLTNTTWLRNFRTWPAPRPEDDGLSLIREALIEFCPENGVVGAELEPEARLGFPAGDFLRLIDMIAPLKFADATQTVLMPLRMVKSKLEIDKVRSACLATSLGFRELPKMIQVGDTEWTACRKLQLAILQSGATRAPKITGCSGHLGYEHSGHGPTNRPLGEGDVLSIDACCQYDFYWSDFNRLFSFGKPVASTVKAYKALYEATTAGMDATVPGARLRDIWAAMSEVMLSHGFQPGSKIGRLGHSMGLSMPELPSINQTADEQVVEGMVLNIEPSVIYTAPEDGRQKVMVHEENISVTDTGYELLSERAAPEIVVIER